jgi:glycosyltransferase involved in cell wall biosynthesis
MHGHYSVSRYSGYMARGDAVIAVSQAIRDYTLHNYPVAPENVHVVHGGTSHEQYPYGYRPEAAWFDTVHAEFPELRGRRWLCLPGRLSRYKGHAEFINLVAELRRDHPTVHGVIAGSGRPGSRYHDELVGLAIAGDVRDRITFTGERRDLREWMAASELVFNLCSEPPEAFGRTVLEALYLGRPVVAWNHGGVAEILSRLYPFGAVPPGNTSALRAQTLTFLRQAPPVDRPEAFSLAQSMRETLAVYQAVLDARRNGENHS